MRREQGRTEQEANLLQVRLNDRGDDKAVLQNQIDTLQQQLDTSQSQLLTRTQEQEQQLQAERAALQRSRQEVEQIRSELEKQKSELAAQGNPEVQRLADKVEQQELELHAKEQRIRDLENQQAAVPDNSELNSLRAGLEQSERELQQTRQLLQQQNSRQASQDNAEVERLTAQLRTQETLLRAWRNLDVLNADVRTLRPWLFTVARRLAIDALRARRSRPDESDRTDVTDLVSPDNPFERVLSTETLRRALTELKPEYQLVIVEMYYHGRTAREIGEYHGIPEGTVKSRLFYGLRALRAAIGSIGDGAP